MTQRRRAAGLVLAALLSLPATSLGAPSPDQVTEATLDNGLKVLIWPDADIPNVAMYLWFRVGSRNEAPGITGVSHFFEHMMFNGAKKYGPGQFDRVMEAAGGSNNAFTSTDVTVYQDWFPIDALETIFDLEADRIGALAIDPKMVASERGVVQSERRTSVEDDNEAVLDEQVRAAAFVAHPYGMPIIGWPSDIAAWTIEDLQRHFRTYYAPNNATLVVVGAVDPAKFLALVKRTLGPIPAQPPGRPVVTVEPPQLGPRRVVVRRPGQLAIVQASFHVPAASDPSFPAIELLQGVLSDGESSRLHRRLVEMERVAIDVSAWLDEGFDPGLFTVQVTVADGADPARVEDVLLQELGRAGVDAPTTAELAKVKNQQLASFWRSMRTIDGKAWTLGRWETFRGGWRAALTAPEAWEAVTAAQIQAIAAATLVADNATIGTLVPVAPDVPEDGHAE